MKTTNSFRSKFFALVLALVASVSSFAKDGYPDFQVDELYYNFLEGDSVQVTFLMPPTIPTEVAADTSNKKNVSGAGYGHLTEIVIPSTVIYEDKTYHVTRIGHGAFMYCPNLMHIDLPTSIKSIGEAAFHNCRYLSSITLNEGLESIEQQAFWGCPTLKEVSLPSTLKSLKQKVFYNSKALSKVISKALVPPIVEKDLLTGTDNYNASIIPNATLYVPAESLEAYKTAAAWKDFGQILPITWSEECYEYRDFNLGIELFPRKSSLVYTLYHTDDRTIEPPYVDSVWILDPELDKQNPLHVHTLYAQPGDTIDLSLLEKNKHYILKVHINECQMSRVFTHRVVKWEYKWCNQWNVLWFDGMRFDETARTSHYQLGQDTVIGDYTYRKFTSRTSVRFTEDWKVYVYYEGFDDNDPYTPDLPTGEYLAYDFSAQVGDTLEVFSGIGTYSTYLCVVDDVQQTDIQTALRTITLHKICRMDTDGDGIEEDYDDREMTWIEGVGSPEGFLISDLPCGWVGGGTNHLLCAYKDDELIYTDSFYERFGCDYNAGVVSEELFPTLSGLQRTICREYCEQADNKTRIEQFTNLTTRTETGAPYIYCSPFLLREKDNKIMIYSRSLNKDLVLYDFNLQVGDSLPMLYIDFFAKDDWIADSDMEIWCIVDYYKDLEGNILPADTLIVTDVSAITLLDGKEYKKWTFNNGMEYVEGICSFGNRQWSGDFFQLIANKDVPTCLLDEHLVCASKNGQLLYKMDDAEMEQLETECLCEYNAEQKPEDLFPTLWGLQRTSCDEWLEGCGENKSYLFAPKEVKEINGKLYLKCGGVFLREEDNKVLIYSFPYEKDLVLYDWTLEIGDTLQNLGIDPYSFPELEYAAVVDYMAYEDYDVETGDFIIKKEPLGNKRVKDISTIRLLDGNEYKAWLFGYDWERGDYYIEGIGNANKYGGDYVDLAHPFAVPTCYYGERLVCVSRDGILLYQMDDTEMERLGTTCLCAQLGRGETDNAKEGKIGGRPTPTQWFIVEINQEVIYKLPAQRSDKEESSILSAETFIYTLENDSLRVNGKKYFNLSRYSSKESPDTKVNVGALHFENDNRVWFYHDNAEYLLYDFSVEVGDTLQLFAGIHNYPTDSVYTHVVTAKDTLEDGIARVTLDAILYEHVDGQLNEQHWEKVWLAGLGSTDGIVHNSAKRASNARNNIEQSHVMLCAWRDDECLYTTNHPDFINVGCEYNHDFTAVDNIQTSENKYQKVIRDGQLLIIRDDKTYNAQGAILN